MDKIIILSLKFYYPIALSLLCFLLAFLIPARQLEKNVLVEFVFSIIRVVLDQLSVQKSKSIVARGLFVVGGLLFLLYPIVRDYSDFFPRRFKMEIYFDTDGLRNSLNSFGASRLSSLRIDKNWEAERLRYFERLNKDLLRANVNFQFLPETGITTGVGEGVFRITRVSSWSQRYKIVEAKGSLVFRSPKFGADETRFLNTEYRLHETESNIVDQSILEVIREHSVVVKPAFRQIIRLSPASEFFDHIIVAATEVVMLPLFDLGKTIYLTRGESGENIPIGYAIYEPRILRKCD